MELKEWKEIELQSESQIVNAEVQIEIANVLLREAVTNIKLLGGKTNVEINEEAKLSK